MSIASQIRIINRFKKMVKELQKKYQSNSAASLELKELQNDLIQFLTYLNTLDQLKPNYNTNEVRRFAQVITIHADILKAEIEKNDYQKLAKAIKGIKTLLKFHSIRYSFFQYIVAWFVEFIYFI